MNNVITPAIDVHHIVSFVNEEDINERKRLAYDVNNLCALSKENHQKIHNDPAFRSKWTEILRKGNSKNSSEYIDFDFTF